MLERCSQGQWHLAVGRFPRNKFPNRMLQPIGLQFQPLWEVIVAEIHALPPVLRIAVQHDVNELNQFFIGHEFQEPIFVAERVRILGNKLFGFGSVMLDVMDLVSELRFELQGYAIVHSLDNDFLDPIITHPYEWPGRSLMNFRGRQVYQSPTRWELSFDDFFPNFM